jgi:uncharacterized membrane protein (DUF485 family)
MDFARVFKMLKNNRVLRLVLPLILLALTVILGAIFSESYTGENLEPMVVVASIVWAILFVIQAFLSIQRFLEKD